MKSQWYYRSGGNKFGPVSPQQLKRLVQEGRIQAATLVWREGIGDWVEAGRVQGLFSRARVNRDSPAKRTQGVKPPPAADDFDKQVLQFLGESETQHAVSPPRREASPPDVTDSEPPKPRPASAPAKAGPTPEPPAKRSSILRLGITVAVVLLLAPIIWYAVQIAQSNRLTSPSPELGEAPFQLVAGQVLLPDYAVSFEQLATYHDPQKPTRGDGFTRSMKVTLPGESEWRYQIRPKQDPHLRLETVGSPPDISLRWIDQPYEILDRNGMVIFSHPTLQDLGEKRPALVLPPFELIPEHPLPPPLVMLKELALREGTILNANAILTRDEGYVVRAKEAPTLQLRFSQPMSLGNPTPTILWKEQPYEILNKDGVVIFSHPTLDTVGQKRNSEDLKSQ